MVAIYIVFNRKRVLHDVWDSYAFTKSPTARYAWLIASSV